MESDKKLTLEAIHEEIGMDRFCRALLDLKLNGQWGHSANLLFQGYEPMVMWEVDQKFGNLFASWLAVETYRQTVAGNRTRWI